MADDIAQFNDTTLELSENTGVFDVTLAIPTGAIVVLIGPSGSGKSTLLRLLLGLLSPGAGTVQIFGQDPTTLNAKQRARIAYVPQKFVLYPDLSVIENIRFARAMYGANSGGHIDEALEVVQLSGVRSRLARELSGGMRRRLQFAAALVSPFDILIADEATAGVDPILRDDMWAYLHSLRDDGRSVLMTTQYITEAEYGDRIAIIKGGHLYANGSAEEIRRQVIPAPIVEIEIDAEHTLDVLRLLEDQPYIEHTYRMPERPRVIRVQVTGEESPLPRIQALLEENNFDPQRVETHHPPFTDVFRQVLEGEPV